MDLRRDGIRAEADEIGSKPLNRPSCTSSKMANPR